MPKLISLIIFNNTQSQQIRQRKRHLYRVHSRSLPDAGERALKNILINKQFIYCRRVFQSTIKLFEVAVDVAVPVLVA